MFCTSRWNSAVVIVASIALLIGASSPAEARHPKKMNFSVTGSGIGPTGLPLPGDAERAHFIDDGDATHLGKHAGAGTVIVHTAVFQSDGTIAGKFGSGMPFVFTSGKKKRDELVCTYGRGKKGEFTGDFVITIVGGTQAAPIAHALFIAEFKVDGKLSTGKFKGAKGKWTMYANSTEPFALGSTEVFFYEWVGEGEVKLKKKKK